MGKLLEALKTKLENVRKQMEVPAPDYREDPKKAMEYIRRQNDLQFLETALGLCVVRALQRLPKEKQDEFYEKCIQEENRGLFTKKIFELRLDPNNSSSKTKSAWLTRDKAFGQSWHKTIETLEEMISPEETDRVLAELDQVKAPSDPSYTAAQKLTYPMADQVQAVRDSLDPNAPETAQDLEILREVNEELAIVSDAVRDHVDRMDSNVEHVTGVQAAMNGYTFDMQNRFIKEELENGKYKDKIPKIPSDTAADKESYAANRTDAQTLSAEDIEALKKHKLTISAPLKNDAMTIINKMAGLGDEKFRIDELTTKTLLGGAPGETVYNSEQGYKFYAYWPLYNARGELAQAVREKDMAKIRTAHEKYKSIRTEMDEMLRIVKKHPTGLCGGNVNSTRALPDDIANPVPLAHMEDFIGHSQINGLFLLYAFGKNINTPVEKILDDPIGTMTEAGKKYVEKYGLGSRKTIGEKLCWGLSRPACTVNFLGDWGRTMAMSCSRGFDGLACLADDPKERDRIAGMGQMAIACGSVAVNEHKKQWEKLTAISEEQRKVLYQHAALLPEEEFDPLQYAEIFSRPDWKEKTDTGALIDRLKREGKLNYSELAGRAEKVIADGKEPDPAVTSNFKADDYIVEARKAYREVLKKASQEERQQEGFKKFGESIHSMRALTDEFQDVQKDMHKKMQNLRTEKTGAFLSSENSDEYKKMLRAQNTFRFKLLQVQGKELPAGVSEEDKNYLKTITLKAAYDTARTATYDYCCKKTDKGRSLSFVHKVGKKRFDTARETLAYMDALADALEIRSPAQKLIDKTRDEVMMLRSKNGWTPEKAEKAAAKLMYAMSVEYQTDSFEEQTKRLDAKRVGMGAAFISGQAAFKKMMNKEGAKSVADYMVEGGGKLTDAYVRGMNSAAKDLKQEPGKDPKQMSDEEKGEVWKNQVLQM